MSSSGKTKKMVNSLCDNYGNCTTFILCDENEDFTKQERQEGEKDFKNFMLLNTPPSNTHKNSKYILAQSTNNGGVIETSPRNDKNKNEIR